MRHIAELTKIAEDCKVFSEGFGLHMAKFAEMRSGGSSGVFNQEKELNYKALDSANNGFGEALVKIGRELGEAQALEKMSKEQVESVLSDVKHEVNIFSAA